jgi:hypothetical protein
MTLLFSLFSSILQVFTKYSPGLHQVFSSSSASIPSQVFTNYYRPSGFFFDIKASYRHRYNFAACIKTDKTSHSPSSLTQTAYTGTRLFFDRTLIKALRL